MFQDRIVTERLILRRPVEADARDIFDAYAQDPEVSRFLVWRPHSSVDTVREFLVACIASWARGSPLTYAITESGSDRVIGMIDARPDGSTVTLGYVLARPHWGKGYMPEAIAALANEAFERGHQRVQAFCDVDNRRSQRSLEKAGFVLEAKLERHIVHPNVSPEPRDCYLFARVR
jgi:RimJ/RimL family protein N-acetyltransferase